MPRVDLLVSNPRHHTAAVTPLAAPLARAGVDARLVSLCGLRGHPPPVDLPPTLRDSMVALGPRRRPAAVRPALGAVAGRRRRWLRTIGWHAMLAPQWRRLIGERPQLVVLPNDTAYPYDRIAAACRRGGHPILLLQEGIRFPLPIEEATPYGSRSDRVAAWGEGSREHFLRAGVPAAAVRVTGSPRFDGTTPLPPPGDDRITLVTNPIDAQALCSTEDKHRLFARFVTALPAGSRLLVRCHPGERLADYLAALPAERREQVAAAGGDLTSVLEQTAAVVVMASTVGLEALLARRQLAVLPVPGHGWVFDYVERGAALGLDLAADLAPQLRALLQPDADRLRAIDAYLDHHLANRGRAAEAVAGLIIELLS